EKSSVIGKNVWKLLVSGMAVSLLSAMLVGLLKLKKKRRKRNKSSL
ncbi:hypothetical protein, partial [Bacillus tropicus]|nr:hypothetical protein [Bacillus tropicus]